MKKTSKQNKTKKKKSLNFQGKTIYHDCFKIGIKLFQTSWGIVNNFKKEISIILWNELEKKNYFKMNSLKKKEKVYFFKKIKRQSQQSVNEIFYKIQSGIFWWNIEEDSKNMPLSNTSSKAAEFLLCFIFFIQIIKSLRNKRRQRN